MSKGKTWGFLEPMPSTDSVGRIEAGGRSFMGRGHYVSQPPWGFGPYPIGRWLRLACPHLSITFPNPTILPSPPCSLPWRLPNINCTPSSTSLIQWRARARIQREGRRKGLFSFVLSLSQVGCIFPLITAQIRQSSVPRQGTTPSPYPFRAPVAGPGALQWPSCLSRLQNTFVNITYVKFSLNYPFWMCFVHPALTPTY